MAAVAAPLPALPAGLDPLFAAQARFRRGDYEGCAARCSALLAAHPFDQAAWLLKCRALTAKSFLDDVDWDDSGAGIAEVLLDDHAVAQAPRPGTSLSAALRPATSAAGAAGAGVAPSRAVVVVKLPRSGGALERAPAFRRAARAARFREYFYGPARGPPALSPELVTVRFEDVVLVKVGGAPPDPGLVPIGRVSALLPLRTQAVAPTAQLVNHVLGVSFAASEAQVPHVNVAGFVHVREVRLEARTLRLLKPCGGPLPGRFLVLGTNVWHEQ